MLSSMALTQEQIKTIIDREKITRFISGYDATDEEMLGVLIAQYFSWDGEKILRTMQYALEDSNFHDWNKKISEVLENA